jgi:DNA-binding NarL/FixJ family response regulator
MGAPIRVAACDDAPAVGMFVQHVPEEDGDMEVVSSTTTGATALEELGRLRPDALLLDLLLPDIPDPAALVRRLRERSPQTAIVLISNMPAPDLRDAAGRLGADAWTLKAQKPAALRATIREVVGAPGPV